MGKRRTDAPHKDRHNDDDSDEVEEETFENVTKFVVPSQTFILLFNLELFKKEPLKPDQIANIKTRKKLIAKRRAPNAPESSHFGVSDGRNFFDLKIFNFLQILFKAVWFIE